MSAFIRRNLACNRAIRSASVPIRKADRAVDGVFGKGFFERVAELTPGVWAGPVASGYGVHLVRIDERLTARTPPLEAIRDRVLRDWKAAKGRELRELHYARLRGRYVVEMRRADTGAAENQ